MAEQSVRNRGSSTAFHVLEIASPSVAPCGRLLAEAGADVVKLEAPCSAAERGRVLDPYALFHDTSKRSITLDLDEPEGRELFLELVARADVVLEGLAPGELARRGLSYETLSDHNSGLVLVSITAFGQDGPYSGFAANDLVTFALGGLMFISGLPGQPPVVAPDRQAYVVAGTHAALATLAALWARRSHGLGDWIDVSMFECLAAQENTITNYQGPGKFTRRNGSQHRTALPGRIFPCKDGHIHVYIGREKGVWDRFLTWLGNPPELANPSLADINVRWQHADLIARLTERFAAERTMAELYDSAQALHLPCVPVYNPAEFVIDRQTVSRELVEELCHPDLGSYRTLRPPLRFLDTQRRPAPGRGEHNQQVYAELLGLSADELIRLREAGVV